MALKQSPGSLLAPDGSQYVVLSDGSGNLSGITGLNPSGATVVASSSGNVAAATATATLAGAVGKTTYISGFLVSGAGATAGSVINGTVVGLLGGTQTFTIAVPTGAILGITPLFIDYNPPLPASAVNTAIVVSTPSFGAGSTNATVSAWGYQI